MSRAKKAALVDPGAESAIAAAMSDTTIKLRNPANGVHSTAGITCSPPLAAHELAASANRR
jgi:hypothetical protein